MKKIYISLKEAENLIFHKCLIIPKNRLDIKRAQGLFSINFSIDETKLLDYDTKYAILFSSVLFFEIPEKELNLFINHYKLPLGLIELSPREIRDTNENQNLFSEINENYNPNKYLQLRNGLIGVCNLGYSYIGNDAFIKEGEKLLNDFFSLSILQKKLLIELSNELEFPLFKVKVDKFVIDTFFRITWWGKFIAENHLNKLENQDAIEIDSAKKWLKDFFYLKDVKEINLQLNKIPSLLNDDKDFLLGYYFAALYFETLQSERKTLNDIYKNIEYSNKNILMYWITFFQSFFDVSVRNLYFIKPVNSEIFKLEKLAFELINNDFENAHIDNFNFIKAENKELLSCFLSLKEGGTNHNPKVINLSEAKDVFKNNFSEDNLDFIGFEFKSQYDVNDMFLNTCWFSKRRFHLNINSDVSVSEITFYLKDDSTAKEKLSNLKLKVKPFSNIIDKNKKILVGFLEMDTYPSLFKIYSSFLKTINKFEKAVFVLQVDLEPEDIQSLKFNDYRREQENKLKMMFNVEIELIVKNKRNNSETEIKRNLKNVLKGYKMEQIEVIDENFDKNKAVWLLESNTEYLIQNKNEQYYSFLNID